MLTISIGHFLAVLKHVLGTFTEVNATSAIRFPTVVVVDPSTGQVVGDPITHKTRHDQIIMSGILKGRTAELDGIVVNIHCQGGFEAAEPFRWVIYGEKGTIEIKSTKDMPGSQIATHEKVVYLNNEKVEVDETELDKKLGNTGKGWLEFAKGDDGVYESLESSVDIYRAVDAALTSIRGGKKVAL